MISPTPVDLGHGVGALFTSRAGGISRPPYDGLDLADHVGDDPADVTTNRGLLDELVSRTTGSSSVGCCYVHQVHGDTVLRVHDPALGTATGHVVFDGQAPDGDAMVTAAVGVPLAILVADCVPVLLADPVARVIGAVHAGRAGLVAGVVGRAIEAMRSLGATEIRAVIGPSVCAGCYEVPARMAAEVEAAVPGAAALTRSGRPSIDLAAGVGFQLKGAGVIDWSMDNRCTVESAELFSYRRDGITGRFAGVVWLEP